MEQDGFERLRRKIHHLARAGQHVQVQQTVNVALEEHRAQALRVLSLPIEASNLHWHPFGVYTIPMAKRRGQNGTWSRRLHIWHPEANPVGEASEYGVHTHSGVARSHVLVGSLYHHLYEFTPDEDGIWQRACLGKPEGRATLIAHVQEETNAGTTHTLPANQPHGVTKPEGFAISLFEQLDGPTTQEFTTWQRTDVAAEELVRAGPVELSIAQRDALAQLDWCGPTAHT